MHIQAVVVGVNKQRFSVDLSLKPSHLRYAHTQTCIHVHIHTHTLIHTCIHTHSTHTVGWSSLSPLLFPYIPPLSSSLFYTVLVFILLHTSCTHSPILLPLLHYPRLYPLTYFLYSLPYPPPSSTLSSSLSS